MLEMFQGEFVDLNGGADFYATTIAGLHEEGRQSLEVFPEMCREDGVKPHKAKALPWSISLRPPRPSARNLQLRNIHRRPMRKCTSRFPGKVALSAIWCGNRSCDANRWGIIAASLMNTSRA